MIILYAIGSIALSIGIVWVCSLSIQKELKEIRRKEGRLV